MKLVFSRQTIILTLLALVSTGWAVTEYRRSVNDGEKHLGVDAVANMLRQTAPDDAFNGIKLEEFENFYRDWTLVTARYRVDRDQQRVTFANPLAWKALVEGSKSFPDGSMFVKTGFQSAEDPLFPSSKTPGSQLRLLVMKRDFAKYPATDGWGYALLNRFGTRLANGEIRYQVEKYGSITEFETACHACHKIAAKQDFVFSKPMFEAALSYKRHGSMDATFEEKFSTPPTPDQIKEITAVLEDTGKLFPATPESFYFYAMPLFEGSLPELKAPLTNLAFKKKAPLIVFDAGSKLFSMSLPLPPVSGCTRREAYFSGCLNKSIRPANLHEVTKAAILCDGITIEETGLGGQLKSR